MLFYGGRSISHADDGRAEDTLMSGSTPWDAAWRKIIVETMVVWYDSYPFSKIATSLSIISFSSGTITASFLWTVQCINKPSSFFQGHGFSCGTIQYPKWNHSLSLQLRNKFSKKNISFFRLGYFSRPSGHDAVRSACCSDPRWIGHCKPSQQM